MMRVIAGHLKGLQLDSVKGHKTHPMSEKMRGAMFNTLGDIQGLTVYDAYGGSGAVAIEAISRGAVSALITEVARPAIVKIKQNINNLKLAAKITVINTAAANWSQSHKTDQFDLVICDPPYDDMIDEDLKILIQNVKLGGLLIVSQPPGHRKLQSYDVRLEAEHHYGDGTLVFYRKLTHQN